MVGRVSCSESFPSKYDAFPHSSNESSMALSFPIDYSELMVSVSQGKLEKRVASIIRNFKQTIRSHRS